MSKYWIQKEFMLFLKKLAPIWIKSIRVKTSWIELKVTSNNLFNLIFLLKNHMLCQIKTLVDLITYDNPNKPLRFSIIYNLLSVQFNARLKIFTQINDTSSLPCASWLEREVWDMFGIFFIKHNDLRRLLTDYGFTQFPLRKDFPVKGFSEVAYFEKEKSVTYAIDQSLQKFRTFYFKNPWFYEKNTYL